jgi:hypothetical protein
MLPPNAAVWATAPNDRELARVLQHRYGDGSVYLLDRGAKQIFRVPATRTREPRGIHHEKGRELLARCGL